MAKQLEFKKVSGHGGKRSGAGRPNRSGLVGHAKRAPVAFKKPLHITLKLKAKMPRLRTREFHRRFKDAGKRAQEFGLYLNHYSIQNDHVHLIVEAKSNRALALGMRSLGGQLGKFIRGVAGGVGSVFRGRFHLHVLKTPTEVRNALRYVLLNYSGHGKLIAHLDDFSSGYLFRDWARLVGQRMNGLMEEQLATIAKVATGTDLSSPQSWLLRVGWQKARPAA